MARLEAAISPKHATTYGIPIVVPFSAVVRRRSSKQPKLVGLDARLGAFVPSCCGHCRVLGSPGRDPFSLLSQSLVVFELTGLPCQLE